MADSQEQPSFPGQIPWQVSAAFTALVYLAAGLIVLVQPCEAGLFVGFCGLSKILVTGLGLFVFAFYLVLLFLLRRGLHKGSGVEAAKRRLNTRSFFLSLLFILFPILLLLRLSIDLP